MFVCVALPGVFAYVRDCGVCVLRMCLWVACGLLCGVVYGFLCVCSNVCGRRL